MPGWHRGLRLVSPVARTSGARPYVRLMPPAYVKPYVKRQKNDMADAEAICEAVTRANMRFVPTKTPEQQSCLMLQRPRHLFIRQQTAVINSVRAHLQEPPFLLDGINRSLRSPCARQDLRDRSGSLDECTDTREVREHRDRRSPGTTLTDHALLERGSEREVRASQYLLGSLQLAMRILISGTVSERSSRKLINQAGILAPAIRRLTRCAMTCDRVAAAFVDRRRPAARFVIAQTEMPGLGELPPTDTKCWRYKGPA
jgi:hypothetical protein